MGSDVIDDNFALFRNAQIWSDREYFEIRGRVVQSIDNDIAVLPTEPNALDDALVRQPDVRSVNDRLCERGFAVGPVCGTTAQYLGEGSRIVFGVIRDLYQILQEIAVVPRPELDTLVAAPIVASAVAGKVVEREQFLEGKPSLQIGNRVAENKSVTWICHMRVSGASSAGASIGDAMFSQSVCWPCISGFTLNQCEPDSATWGRQDLGTPSSDWR